MLLNPDSSMHSVEPPRVSKLKVFRVYSVFVKSARISRGVNTFTYGAGVLLYGVRLLRGYMLFSVFLTSEQGLISIVR